MTDALPGYGLARPTVADALTSVRRAFGPRAGDVWNTALTAAGLAGDETDDAALERLLTAMPPVDPVCAVIARGLRVRIATYARLAAAPARTSDVPASGEAAAHLRPRRDGYHRLAT
jgi:hypothetical protein